MKPEISRIQKSDLNAISNLCKRMNELQVIPNLNSEGRRTMREAAEKDSRSILDKKTNSSLKAVINGNVVGYICWANGSHITQLYVDLPYQRKGIGSKLVSEVVKRSSADVVTLRASINAVLFYERLGFIRKGVEQSTKGIRFIAMELSVER